MKISSFILLFSFVCLISSCQDKGWKPLFNGKDLSGWQIKCRPEDSGKNYWKVENGVILGSTEGDRKHDNVWLLSDGEYKDFNLKLQFAAFKTPSGNGGVQFRSRYDMDKMRLEGAQIDINPPGPWRTGLIWDETSGYLKWLFPFKIHSELRESDALGKADFYYSDEKLTWNNLEINVQGMVIKAWLNGVLVTDYNGEGILNDSIHKAHNVGETGCIGFQMHPNEDMKLMFRELYIKELK